MEYLAVSLSAGAGSGPILRSMEYALYKFQKIFHTQGSEKAKEFARSCRMDMEGDRIKVVIETNPQEHAILAQSLAHVVMDQVRALGEGQAPGP